MHVVKSKTCFNNCVTVDCVGHGRDMDGRLALLWNDNLQVTLKSFSQNHISGTVIYEAEEQL